MSKIAYDSLPQVLKSVSTRPLFVMHLDAKKPMVIGATPSAFRQIIAVPSGTFAGERISGLVLDGGSDWQIKRRDGATELDVRLTLQTDEGDLICMTYKGLRHGPTDVIEKLERGEIVDPASIYFRINPLFETASKKYDWINRILAIGVGHRLPDGPVYSIFEVL